MSTVCSESRTAPSRGSASAAWLCFLLLQAVACGFVFRDATVGKSILAPLDVLPACFTHYRFVEPNTTGIPSGSLQFDQVVYDLPLQHGIYQAYHRGEIPWWDPFGYSGRPFLADAHINGTDPVRLLAYAVLPFELAYNWTRIGHFILSGATMLLLLRHFRFPFWLSLIGALTFEFAGCQAFFFGFPWVQASLLYYPLLWLGWDGAFHTGKRRFLALGALAVAGLFYSGNLQSHSYVVLFSIAFALGYGGVRYANWRKLIPIIALSGALGACLAAPVLLSQLEFFLQGVRGVRSAAGIRTCLLGLACLTSIYPWMLGDFRTLDIRSAFFQPVGLGQNYGVGFHTFIGSAAFVLALLGAFMPCPDRQRQLIRRTSVCLALLFLLIASSPFITVFYTRSAGLFVLGALMLAILALEQLSFTVRKHPLAGWTTALLAIAIGLGTNIGALVLYPKVLPKVRETLQRHESATPAGTIFKLPAAYRQFQIENLPNQVSFKNPEAFLAFLGLLLLASVLLWPSLRQRTGALALVAALNFLPPLLYCQRLIPRQPKVLWERLLAGGPKQQEAVRLLSASKARLLESAHLRNEFVFPDELEHLYQVHTVHGYSALVPKNISSLGVETFTNRYQVADYIVADEFRALGPTNRTCRFQWPHGSARPLQIVEESLGQIRVRIDPGPAAALLWTDTFYPGWRATLNGRDVVLDRAEPCFTQIQIPAGQTDLQLQYRPRFLSKGLAMAGAGITGLLLVLVLPWRSRGQIEAANPRTYADRC